MLVFNLTCLFGLVSWCIYASVKDYKYIKQSKKRFEDFTKELQRDLRCLEVQKKRTLKKIKELESGRSFN